MEAATLIVTILSTIIFGGHTAYTEHKTMESMDAQKQTQTQILERMQPVTTPEQMEIIWEQQIPVKTGGQNDR